MEKQQEQRKKKVCKRIQVNYFRDPETDMAKKRKGKSKEKVKGE